jgi:hypothetical protein
MTNSPEGVRIRVKGKLKEFVWVWMDPAVLVRLDAVSVADLERLLTASWRCQAPTDLTNRATRGR